MEQNDVPGREGEGRFGGIGKRLGESITSLSFEVRTLYQSRPACTCLLRLRFGNIEPSLSVCLSIMT